MANVTGQASGSGHGPGHTLGPSQGFGSKSRILFPRVRTPSPIFRPTPNPELDTAPKSA